MNNELKTIGYGNDSFDSFLNLLKTNNIKVIVDVRTNPFSRFNPKFRIKVLSELLKEEGIEYIFMGDSLGGKPKDQMCYTEGKLDYKKIIKQKEFINGIKTLENLIQENKGVCIMCAEKDPNHCHRKSLIAPILETKKISVSHIDKLGLIENEILFGS